MRSARPHWPDWRARLFLPDQLAEAISPPAKAQRQNLGLLPLFFSRPARFPIYSAERRRILTPCWCQRNSVVLGWPPAHISGLHVQPEISQWWRRCSPASCARLDDCARHGNGGGVTMHLPMGACAMAMLTPFLLRGSAHLRFVARAGGRPREHGSSGIAAGRVSASEEQHVRRKPMSCARSARRRLNVVAFLTSGVVDATRADRRALRDAAGSRYNRFDQPAIVLRRPGDAEDDLWAMERRVRFSLYIEDMFATGLTRPIAPPSSNMRRTP